MKEVKEEARKKAEAECGFNEEGYKIIETKVEVLFYENEI